MDKAWSALLKFFFGANLENVKEVASETPPSPPLCTSRERQIDTQCHICSQVESFYVTEEIDHKGRINWELSCCSGEILAAEKGWQKLWVVGWNMVCPSCVAQMKRAIVPGHGVELVPEAMVKEGRAFLTSDFKAQTNMGAEHREKLNEN